MKIIVGHLMFLLLMPLCIQSQNLLPPIHNYKVFEYKAASKNWGLSVNERGELYVANNKGLLHFNGEQWVLYELPNKTTIRSVASIGNRIYTGSYEEFGFWENNQVGQLEYTSLTHLIKDTEFSSEEFWQILSYRDEVIFRSFSKIYSYKENSIHVLNPKFFITNLTEYDNKLVVAGNHMGLFSIQNDSLIPFEDQSLLVGKNVIDMVPYNGGLLIGTKLNGCYLLKNGRLSAWEDTLNLELKTHQLNKILSLKSGNMAFGTIKNGIYFYNGHTKSHQKLNRQLGLQNNTVLSMIRFEDQLWVGLDNGLDRIHLNNPLTYYTDYSGVVGTVYDLAIHEGILYLGSNTGIYYFEDDQLHFIEGSQGHVWDLEVANGSLFCGHNTGTFKVSKGSLEKVSTITGGYQMVKAPESNSIFIQGTYIGLAKYEKDKHGKWQVTPIKGIDFPVKYLCFEDTNIIWVAHAYKGIRRIVLNKEFDTVLEEQEFDLTQIPNNYNVRVYNIRNQIALYSDGIWYKYDPILNKIILFEEFQDYNQMSLTYYDDEFFWFIDNDGSKEVINTDLKERHFVLDDAQLRRRLAPESERIIRLNDSIHFFTLNDGFGKLNTSRFRNQLLTSELPKPTLVSFNDLEKRLSLTRDVYSIPYKKSQDITIQVSAASLVYPKYNFELKGAKEQRSIIDNGTLHFQNLPFGSYELQVSTINIDNEKSEPIFIRFNIAPPWYLSNMSVALYALAIIGIFFLIRWVNRQKLEKRHNKLKERLNKEKEDHLAQLEKEKLEKEIKSKQKELTSTTMNVAKKNELILELKNLLFMNKG